MSVAPCALSRISPGSTCIVKPDVDPFVLHIFSKFHLSLLYASGIYLNSWNSLSSRDITRCRFNEISTDATYLIQRYEMCTRIGSIKWSDLQVIKFYTHLEILFIICTAKVKSLSAWSLEFQNIFWYENDSSPFEQAS